MTKGGCVAGWNLTGNAVSAEFDGSDDQERKELSVSQAVEIAAGALDAIPQLSVLGEVTGFRGPNARSGHCYFQIKDDSAAVDCIIWKGAYLKRTFDLRDGMQVSFKGSFNLYKATGRMSFVARSFSLAGEGLLHRITESGSPDRYDRTERHDHLICSRCGKIADVHLPDMQSRIEHTLGREILSYDLKIRYICPDCREQEKDNLMEEKYHER